MVVLLPIGFGSSSYQGISSRDKGHAVITRMVACKVLGLDFDKKGKWVCGDQSWQKELIGDGLALIHYRNLVG
jgi:hypothetical protein